MCWKRTNNISVGKGINKIKVLKCWTYNIFVGGGFNKSKVQEYWKWTCNILVRRGYHHFSSKQVFQPVQISRCWAQGPCLLMGNETLPLPIDFDINVWGREGVNKMKVQKCWKWTYNISVGGLTNESPKVLGMNLKYLMGDGVNKTEVQNAGNGLTIFWRGVPWFWFKTGISASANFTTLSTGPLSVDGEIVCLESQYPAMHVN